MILLTYYCKWIAGITTGITTGINCLWLKIKGMGNTTEFYTMPSSMEPLFPKDPSKILEDLVIALISKEGELSGKLHPITRSAIADLLRPMNSYYSNLIEGHDTHPIEIHNALNKNYSADRKKRNLQLEAYAHIKVHKAISDEVRIHNGLLNTSSTTFIKGIHKKFYDHLPESFRRVKSKEGLIKQVVPGEFRDSEVEVGEHISPHSKSVQSFMERFEKVYEPAAESNTSKIKRVISIAASHHRLAWIHPFLDGNGRVVRLHSDASFINEGLDASGLWSISRGLARKKDEYMDRLANADQKRLSDHDGKGNLSDKALVEFCKFFLEVAIDQMEYMSSVIDIDNMLNRLEKFGEYMSLKDKLKPEAKHILTTVFLKGKISKSEAMRITEMSDKTLKILTDEMIRLGLLTSTKEGIEMMYYVNYPITYSASIFPGLYPSGKELDLIANI